MKELDWSNVVFLSDEEIAKKTRRGKQTKAN